MESMNHESIIGCCAVFLKAHPVVSFVTGFAMMLSASATSVYDMSIPTIFMQIGQWIAWLFIYCTGAVTIIGFLEKTFDFKLKFNFLKRKKK